MRQIQYGELMSNSYVEPDGAIKGYTGWDRTDYIDISDYKYLIANISTTYASFYYANQEPAAPAVITTNTQFTIPDGAKYIIISQTATIMGGLVLSGYFNGGEIAKIKSRLSLMDTATSEDAGKALLAKTVTNGSVTEWEFGETGSTIELDATLTDATKAAQAKAVGDVLLSFNDNYEHATDEYTESVDYGEIYRDSWFANNGSIQNNKTGYSRTDYILCNGVYAFVINFTTENYRVVFFDSNKAKIATNLTIFNVKANTPYLIPPEAYYVGISGVTTSMETLTMSFIKHGAFFALNNDVIHKIQEVSNMDSILTINYGGEIYNRQYITSKSQIAAMNLFDKDNLLMDTDITGATKSGYVTMDYYLPVYEGVNYCVSATPYQQYGYDEYYNVVNTNLGLSTTAKTLPSNVKYLKICIAWNYNNAVFGIYANIDQYNNVYTKYGKPLPYKDADENFAEYINNKALTLNNTAVLADSGRYSGIEEIEQYSKLVHPTNNSLEIHDSTVGDDWYERGVKQYFTATGVIITQNSGTAQIYPSEYNLNVGDSIYVGFLARSQSKQPLSTRFTGTFSYWSDNPIYFDEEIRLYEFECVISQEQYDADKVQFNLSASIEFSNIYISTESNKKYQHLFIDPLRKATVDKILTTKFKNCNWTAFGDSITAMGYFIQYTNEQMPFASINNHGIGGACAIDLTTGATSSGSVIVDNYETEIRNAHLVTIGYGCNDSRFFGKSTSASTGETVELGTIEEIGASHNKGTFYGALQYMIEKILTWNPTVKIVIAIQPSSTIIDFNDYTPEQIAVAEATAQAQIDVANKYRIPYADFFHKCGLVYGFNADSRIPDGVHPTRTFGYVCSRELVSILDRIYINEGERSF